MDTTVLQVLIGNLSFGLQSAPIFQHFQDGLRLPDDGKFNLVAANPDGKRVSFPIVPNENSKSETTTDLGYCSVFILSQQVYFGKLKIAPDKRFVTIQDPHYLLPHINGRRELRLVRAGEEMHQPAAEMTLNMAYVILWQPLGDESVIVRAIEAGLPKERK